MKRFKRYEWYKDSGVEWIGKIPLHWEQVRMKFLCKVNPSKSDLKVPRNTKVTFLPMENIGEDGTLNLNEERELTDVWDGFTYFKDDDVIIAKITPCFENGKGALCRNLINGLGFGTTELHVLRAKNQVVPGFIWYVTKSHGFRVMGEAMMQGAAGQKRVPKDFIENFVVCVPTPVEQQAIVNFLDQKTAEIDSLIADKEKLIELLQEQRQAIITQAVTKGLDPNVPMKDSGVEWIGEIPEHWDICKIKYIVNKDKNSIKAGPFGSQLKSEDIIESGIKVYNQANVIKKDLSICSDYISEKKYKELEAFTVFENDILVTSRGTIGRVVIVTSEAEKGVLHPCLLKMSINTDLYKLELIDFIFNETRIVQNQIEFLSNATTIDVIYTDTLKNIILPFPPKEEQDSILNYIYQKVKEIDSLVFSISNQLGKLKEYRQSLITAAVTGKIDVRDYIVDNDKEEGEEQEEVS